MRYLSKSRCWLPVIMFLAACSQLPEHAGAPPPAKQISKAKLLDKIRGGWAGQTIGVTFGWPTEFRYTGTFIQDYEPIRWTDDYVNEAMTRFPGLYDDIYVDLTFVEVFDRLGLQAPLDSFAAAFARKEYELWHANQACRYNLQQGMAPAEAGHWLHNPHADDIDFQIEADFAGLMSPGIPGAATALAHRLGRMMNSGDGLYGGIYVANLYALAFVQDDLPAIVTEALAPIPPQSKFYQCITDVIAWHKQYPTDWKATWFEIQKKWSEETGCPNGIFHPLDIDAKLNAAYVVAGLLYGEGDFTKTMEITTRMGQDSDCNPATAGGVLGVIKGYDALPAYWMTALRKAEQRPFSYTAFSLEKAYAAGYRHALAHLQQLGADTTADLITIPVDKKETVPFEENFAGHFPRSFLPLSQVFTDRFSFSFEGNGFVLRGYAGKKRNEAPDYTLRATLTIDGQAVETASFPTEPRKGRTDLFWRYQLTPGRHDVTIQVLNPHPDYTFTTVDCLVYDNKKHPAIR